MERKEQSTAISSVSTTQKRNSTKSGSNEKVMETDEIEIFLSQYKAFHYIHGKIDDCMIFMGDDNKADIHFQKAKLPVVEYLTNKVNFFARSVLGYPTNIVQSFDINSAFEVEEGYQVSALVMVQMHAIDAAYHELAWMLGEDAVESVELVDQNMAPITCGSDGNQSVDRVPF